MQWCLLGQASPVLCQRWCWWSFNISHKLLMDQPWESKPVSAYGHKQSHIPLINSSPKWADMFLAFQYFCFLFLNMQVFQKFCLKLLQRAGWLVTPGWCGLLSCLGFSKSKVLFLSRALFPIRDKTQKWFVMQLVKCLVPKSDSWILLSCSCGFALPSAHWEPWLQQGETISHGISPSAHAQTAVPSLACSSPNLGGICISDRKWPEKANQERVSLKGALLIPVET